MADEDKKPTGEWPKDLDPRLKEFIDRAIVPILVQEWFKEQHAEQSSTPGDDLV